MRKRQKSKKSLKKNKKKKVTGIHIIDHIISLSKESIASIFIIIIAIGITASIATTSYLLIKEQQGTSFKLAQKGSEQIQLNANTNMRIEEPEFISLSSGGGASDAQADWQIEEGSGLVVEDISGNQNTGTITGATWVDGTVGKALDFNSSNQYVQADYKGENFSSTLTIDVWVNFDKDSGNYPILSKEDSFLLRKSGKALQFFIWVNEDDDEEDEDDSDDEDEEDDSDDEDEDDEGDDLEKIGGEFFNHIEKNRWYHIVATANGTNLLVYLDDQLSTKTYTYSQAINTGTESIFIAKDNNQYLDGKIDSATFYTKTLTSEEIKSKSIAQKQENIRLNVKNIGKVPIKLNPDYGFLKISRLDGEVVCTTSLADKNKALDSACTKGCNQTIDSGQFTQIGISLNSNCLNKIKNDITGTTRYTINLQFGYAFDIQTLEKNI